MMLMKNNVARVNGQVTRNWLAALVVIGNLYLFHAHGHGAVINSSQPRVIASSEADWPQWRGARRDGVCTETGLLPSWPEAGPELLWKISGLGKGYACPIIVGNRIYITGDKGEDLILYALDLTGNTIWTTTNGASWKEPYPGSRACVTYSEGKLFHLNAHGRLVCLDASNGTRLWQANLLKDYEGRNITWAMSECVVVDDHYVYAAPGGYKATMVAFDKRNGKPVWTSPPLESDLLAKPEQASLGNGRAVDSAGYASPLLFELQGHRLLVSCSQRHVYCVDADKGTMLWTYPLPTTYSVLANMPLLCGDRLFVTAAGLNSSKLFRFKFTDEKLEAEVIEGAKVDTCHGQAIYREGKIYTSYYRASKGWACLDAVTGALLYQCKELAMGSIIYADKRLYILSQEGEMALIKPGNESFEFTGRFRLVPPKVNDAWAHPVILKGRLYLRYHDTFWCYGVKK
jgi:outer membrane protein assembly factor BamB